MNADALLQSPRLAQDLYEVYRTLRAEHPVQWSEVWNCWLVLGYRDVQAALRDPRFSSSKMQTFSGALPENVRRQVQPLITILSGFLGLSDPPDHTRLRRLINKAFTPRVVEGMQARIQGIVDDLLDRVAQSDTPDIVTKFAYPLPATVITEMLGLPSKDVQRFKTWSDDIVGFIGAGRATPERAERGQESMMALADYYRPIIEERRRQPQDDLLSAMTSAQDRGDRLTDIELLATSITLLAGRHETTAGLIGNGLLALAQHPNETRRLRQEPALLTGAIKELLRYDSPVQRAERVAVQDVEVSGKWIKRGDRVFLVIGSANRDPEQFEHPDTLDLARRDNKHVAFGQGIHFCIGAPLAQLEGAIAIQSFLDRFENFQLTNSTLDWQESVAIRSLKSLTLHVERNSTREDRNDQNS